MNIVEINNKDIDLLKDNMYTKMFFVRYEEDLHNNFIFSNSLMQNIVIFYINKEIVLKYLKGKSFKNVFLIKEDILIKTLEDKDFDTDDTPGFYRYANSPLIKKMISFTRTGNSCTSVIPFITIDNLKENTLQHIAKESPFDRCRCIELCISENEFNLNRELITDILITSGFLYVLINFRSNISTDPFN